MATTAPQAPEAAALQSSLSDKYQRWDLYDADAAIAQTEADAERDDRRRARDKSRQALETLEGRVLARAKELSAAALSRAKVERLRASRKRISLSWSNRSM